jgi:hypothetical protein
MVTYKDKALQFNLTEVLLFLKIIEINSHCLLLSGMVQREGSCQYVIVNFVAIDSVSVKPFFSLRKLQAIVDLFRNH